MSHCYLCFRYDQQSKIKFLKATDFFQLSLKTTSKTLTLSMLTWRFKISIFDVDLSFEEGEVNGKYLFPFSQRSKARSPSDNMTPKLFNHIPQYLKRDQIAHLIIVIIPNVPLTADLQCLWIILSLIREKFSYALSADKVIKDEDGG